MSSQKVITPDCPKCHGALWFVPCHGAGCSDEHFFCDACGVVWSYRATEAEWIRFELDGRISEILPPRKPRFRRST